MMKTKLSVAVVMLVLSAALSAKDGDDRFLSVFAPLRTEVAALSPDGKRLAYSVRDGDQISILSLEVGTPQRATSVVTVAADQYATRYMEADYKHHPSRIEWLQWVTPERLVVQSNMTFLSTEAQRGSLFGFDCDGKNARMIFSARQGGGSLVTIDRIPGAKPEVMVLIGNQFGNEWVAVDAFAGSNRRLTKHEYRLARSALADRDAQDALRREKQAKMLTSLLRDRRLTWFGHYGESERLLVQWQDVADPGAFVVVDPEAGKAWEFVRSENGTLGVQRHRSEKFDLRDAAGRRYTGTIVLPRSPRVKKAPLVLWMSEVLGGRASATYKPEVRALAEMGFAVAVVDGLAAATRDSGKAIETVREWKLPENPDDRFERPSEDYIWIDQAAEVAHQVRALELLADRFPVSRTAVALFGKGGSAVDALTVAAQAPGRFRCVVAVNPLGGSRFADGAGYPGFDEAMAKLETKPLDSALILGFRGMPGRRLESPYLDAARFAWVSLKKKGTKAEWKFLSPAFMAGQPAAKAAVFRDIEKFLVGNLISYSVRIGEMTELESFPDADSAAKK